VKKTSVPITKMNNNLEEQLRAFERLPGIDELLSVLMQIRNCRNNSTLDIIRTLEIQQWYTNKYITELPDSARSYVQQYQTNFTAWISDKVYWMDGRIPVTSLPRTQIVHNSNNHSNRFPLPVVQVPHQGNGDDNHSLLSDSDDNATHISARTFQTTATARTTSSAVTTASYRTKYTTELIDFVIESNNGLNLFEGAKNEFNKKFRCILSRGRLIKKDKLRRYSLKIMTHLFQCSCRVGVESGVVFQFVHIEGNDVRDNDYMFRAYTQPEKEELVRNHFTVIESATERSVGEATAEAAQTIATILVTDTSPNAPPSVPATTPSTPSNQNYTNQSTTALPEPPSNDPSISVPASATASVAGMLATDTSASVVRFPESTLPEHQSSDLECELGTENMVYVTTNEDQNQTADEIIPRNITTTPSNPTNITTTPSNPTERVLLTINETTIPLELLATSNDTLTDNITPTTGADEVEPREEDTTTTNDHRNSTNIEPTNQESNAHTNHEENDILVDLNFGAVGEIGSNDGANEDDSIEPSVVLVTNAERNRLLAQNKWKLDGKIKVSQYEKKKMHVKWYFDNILISIDTIQCCIGYYEVEYPTILYEEESDVNETIVDNTPETNQICNSCITRKLKNGEKISRIRPFNHSNDNSCDHIFCEVCTYRWYLYLPSPSEYLKEYINRYCRKECSLCKQSCTGHLVKNIYDSEKLVVTYPDDWLQNHLVPDNRPIWLIHQVPVYGFCNYIISSTLAFAIKNIELKTSSGIPVQRPRPITNIQQNHEKRYKTYCQAVYESFRCSECDKKYYCIEQCIIQNCKCEENQYICRKCVANDIVSHWGSRIGNSETKYLQGLLECFTCKTKGRVIHCVTGQYMTKYKDESER
jgi:hypothetical protein